MANNDSIETRGRYRFFTPVLTRWSDNDVYGHVNNIIYYAYFDTAVTTFLMTNGWPDMKETAYIVVIAESSCTYHRAVAHPDELEVGVRTNRIGKSSVQYGLALFRKDEDQAVASGSYTHVFVDRASNKAIRIPEHIREAYERILA